jgi:peptidoglycan/LPS O-acetylase OafA/YrhL
VATERAADRLTMPTTRTLNYRPDIDGLRAVAVLMVLVFHFSLLPVVTGGFLGVDVFFVISGFLITAIITQQLDSQKFKLRVFYVNRIRRLAPALFVVLLGVMGVGVLWLFPSGLLDLSKQVLAAQFYFANIYYWRNVNYLVSMPTIYSCCIRGHWRLKNSFIYAFLRFSCCSIGVSSSTFGSRWLSFF